MGRHARGLSLNSSPMAKGPRNSAARSAGRTLDLARDRATGWLSHQAAVFPNLEIEPPDEAGLSNLDAAFAHAIYVAAIVRWRTLERLLDHVMAPRRFTGIDPLVRGVLLGGLAQIYLLDRVPRHAAIDEAVEWAKQRVRTDAGKFVNAVLRRSADLLKDSARPREEFEDRRDQFLLSEGRALGLTHPVFPEDPVERAAVQCSLGPGMVRRWFERLGDERAAAMARHSVAEPPVTINARHAAGNWQSDFTSTAFFSPHADTGLWIYHGPSEQLTRVLRERRDLWVQDAASTRPVLSLNAIAPKLVVDLCAGRGTKTRQLAALFPSARIIATDVDQGRLAALRAVFRADPKNSAAAPERQVQTPAPGEVPALVSSEGGADLVLLDVPCSNTGVLARRIEARYRLNSAMLARLVETQRQILRQARELLKPGGAILYATCSVEAEENQQQAEWAARELALTPGASEFCEPAGQPGETPTAYRDASFSVILFSRD